MVTPSSSCSLLWTGWVMGSGWSAGWLQCSVVSLVHLTEAGKYFSGGSVCVCVRGYFYVFMFMCLSVCVCMCL